MTEIKRRTLVKGSAWAAPAVLVAEAAAQAATSPNDIIPVAQMYMKMRGTPENINAAGVAAGRKGLTCTVGPTPSTATSTGTTPWVAAGPLTTPAFPVLVPLT